MNLMNLIILANLVILVYMVTLVIQMNLVTIVEHGKTGNCDESGDSRQHGESVDSG